jgi:hypothetical protein
MVEMLVLVPSTQVAVVVHLGVLAVEVLEVLAL